MLSVAHAFMDTATARAEAPFIMLVSDPATRYGRESATISYGEGLSVVSRLAEHYTRMLEVPSDPESGVTRVALALENRPEFFFHWLALNGLGFSVVPINPQWQSAELEYVLNHSDARLAVVIDATQQALTGSLAPCPVVTVDAFEPGETEADTGHQLLTPVGAPERECALLYTSGTTGRPKGR